MIPTYVFNKIMSQEYTNGFLNEQTKMENFEEINIPVPWGTISGKWWGSRAKQPVIAIHGWQDNAGTFDNLAPLLCNDIPIFCIDLPGHGLSSHYPIGQYYYIFWDGIMILRRIIKHFNWTKVKLIGHSLGGAISFLYAASYPDEVDSYISFDIASPTVRNPEEMVSSIGNSVDKYLKYETLSEDGQPRYDRDEMLNIVYEAHHGKITKKNCEILMRRGMKPLKNNEYSFSRDVRLKVPVLGFFTMDQVMEFASRITCAVMNIRGNPGMKWSHPENYDKVLNKIQQTARYMERHVVPGDHHLHLNNADSVAEIVHNFLLLN